MVAVGQTKSPAKEKSWIDWFESRPSSDVINKGAQEQLFKVFESSVTKDDCMAAVLNHQETVFLYKENFGTGRVALFHHFTKSGGTVYDGTTTYGFLFEVPPSMSLSKWRVGVTLQARQI